MMMRAMAMYRNLMINAPRRKSSCKCSIAKQNRKIMGMVAGYRCQDAVRLPRKSAMKDRCKPQPGQSMSKACLIGHLSKCDSSQFTAVPQKAADTKNVLTKTGFDMGGFGVLKTYCLPGNLKSRICMIPQTLNAGNILLSTHRKKPAMRYFPKIGRAHV